MLEGMVFLVLRAFNAALTKSQHVAEVLPLSSNVRVY